MDLQKNISNKKYPRLNFEYIYISKKLTIKTENYFFRIFTLMILFFKFFEICGIKNSDRPLN